MPLSSNSNTSVHILKVHTLEDSIHLHIQENVSVREALDLTGTRVRAACGGLGTCGACLIQTIRGNFSSVTLPEYQKIPISERENNIRLACQLYVHSDAEVYLENPAPKSQWKNINISNWPIYSFTPKQIDKNIYGVAVDVGTTHIRLSLWNLQCLQRISCRHGNNPQSAFGADVLTRLDAERLRGQHLESLTDIVRNAIIDGIRDILARNMGEISSVLNETGKVMIVGNTVMLALLGGDNKNKLYNPDNWEKSIDCQINNLDQWRKSWRMPNVDIVLQQPIAGFIGSDILADLLIIDMINGQAGTLLVDFGTNIEIALWDGKILWLTSVPGGSAFEGIGLENSFFAEAGAITHVRKTNNQFQLETLFNETARGFCASGFVDAIALLRAENIIKRSGRFSVPVTQEGYLLIPENCHTAIKSNDIDAFQRGKAAAAAAMQQLLSLANLNVDDLDKLWVCGAFGENLDIDHAQSIGLLPIIEREKIYLFENAALAGCEKMLLDPESEFILKTLRALAKVINLAINPEYEECFINNLPLQTMLKRNG